MKFLVNVNRVIVCISNDLFINQWGLYQCDGATVFCERDLVLYEGIEIPEGFGLDDLYIDGQFIKAPNQEPVV